MTFVAAATYPRGVGSAPHRADEAASRELAGTRFGPFRVVGVLARGGMGEVLLARRSKPAGGRGAPLARPVALKRLAAELAVIPRFADLFRAEARLVSRLRHRNVARALEASEVDGQPFLALEWAEGGSLRAAIDAAREGGVRLEAGQVRRWLLQLCAGAAHLHGLRDPAGRALGLVHRDLHPRNVVLSARGEAQLIDFGAAAAAALEPGAGAAGPEGAFASMSPEQARGGPVDARSDVFALGVVLYELLTLRHPFRRRGIARTLEAVQREAPPPPSALVPEHAPFDPVVARALDKDPDLRPPGAAALAQKLREISLPRRPRRGRSSTAARSLLLALIAAAPGAWAGPQLQLRGVEASRQDWPRARAYVAVTDASGAPLRGLGPDLFEVREIPSRRPVHLARADSVRAAGRGVAVALVVQASGPWLAVCGDLREAASALASALGPQDQLALIRYGGGVTLLSPPSGDRAALRAAIERLSCEGRSLPLFDALAQALELLSGPSSAALPEVRAVAVISDGRDQGSRASMDAAVARAARAGIPILSIGHAEEQADSSLAVLGQLARRTAGADRRAPAAADLGGALTAALDGLAGTYVLEWRTGFPHDGAERRLEIALSGAPPVSALLRTPRFSDWTRNALLAAALLLGVAAAALASLAVRARARRARPEAGGAPEVDRPRGRW